MLIKVYSEIKRPPFTCGQHMMNLTEMCQYHFAAPEAAIGAALDGAADAWAGC